MYISSPPATKKMATNIIHIPSSMIMMVKLKRQFLFIVNLLHTMYLCTYVTMYLLRTRTNM